MKAGAFDLGSRLASPRPAIRQSRKRALSSSPYPDSLDLGSMIRFSPNSLVSIMNGSRSSSTSGSYGHLSAGTATCFRCEWSTFSRSGRVRVAGALSPAMGLPPLPAAHLQQLQAHLIRTGSLSGSLGGSLGGHTSPFLSHPGMLHQSAGMQTHQHPHNLFQLSGSGLGHHPPPMGFMHGHPGSAGPAKPEFEATKKESVTSTMDHDGGAMDVSKLRSKIKKEPGSVQPALAMKDMHGEPMDDDGHDGSGDPMKDEPGDFIETHCHWRDCDKEFATQDDLVKHINNDHIHANKKSFVCRWKECSREEKPFKAQYMLVVHMRRHTGEKPHKCTVSASVASRVSVLHHMIRFSLFPFSSRAARRRTLGSRISRRISGRTRARSRTCASSPAAARRSATRPTGPSTRIAPTRTR